jgi:flagellar biogenesis protein FliO
MIILYILFLAYLVRRLVVRSTPGATRGRATRKRLRRDRSARAKRFGLVDPGAR